MREDNAPASSQALGNCGGGDTGLGRVEHRSFKQLSYALTFGTGQVGLYRTVLHLETSRCENRRGPFEKQNPDCVCHHHYPHDPDSSLI
jgi:hypothetical protein